VCCVEGEELTAFDVARCKGHVECIDLLRQSAAKSAVECRGGKERLEVEQVVQKARDAAARDAEYWISDELELRRHAADVVSTTLNNATALLSRLHVDETRPTTHVRHTRTHARTQTDRQREREGERERVWWLACWACDSMVASLIPGRGD